MSDTPAGKQWTEAQQDAITATGSLLVSAAAGSGKTSVLAEHCAWLVCDAPRRCNVSELCVVTFTEAAALEMRSRIETTLRARLAAHTEDPHLRRQFALIDQAQVSTLHALCVRLLRQNFHQLALDPEFRVLDADEADLMQTEVARDLFLDRYEGEQSPAFRAFIDALGEGRDQGLANRVIDLHETLCSIVNPVAWMNQSLDRLRAAARLPLGESELGQEYLRSIAQQAADLSTAFDWTISTLQRLGFAPYVDYLQKLTTTLADLRRSLDNGEYDGAVAAFAAAKELPKAPSMPSAMPGKELAKDIFDRIRDSFAKGTLASSLGFTTAQWQQSVALSLPHAQQLLELVMDFARRYKAAKTSQRVLDFSDLERLTLKLLSDSSDATTLSAVAKDLHRRYQHVLVDEYQDINELQDTILNLLSRECIAARKPEAANLFCVGDVKQSIYGFRLADPQRFLRRDDAFRRNHPFGRVIDLQANFRSRAPLLHAVNDIFRRLMRREAVEIEYDKSQELIPRADFADNSAGTTFTGAPIELHILPRDLATDGEVHADAAEGVELERTEREGLLIARQIQAMMGLDGGPRRQVSARNADGSPGTRDLRYSDIVILLRAMRYHAEQYARVLRDAGVPVFNSEGGGYFAATEVRDIVALLRILDNRLQDVPMAAFLRSPIAALPSPDTALATIRIAYPAMPFAAGVLRYAAEHADALADQLRSRLSLLDHWRELSRHRSAADLLWQIYEESGYLASVAALESGSRRVANLLSLYDRARQFGTFSRQGLYHFNRFLADLNEQADPSQAADVSPADDVVRILSIHKSKGLEFPVVFIPEMGKAFNLSSTEGAILADRDAGLAIVAVDVPRLARYPSLATAVVQQRLRRAALAEEMRVLYVALTRAREHVVLIGTAADTTFENWQRRWASHTGPMPTTDILSASTFLSWLGPVAIMTEGDARPPLVALPLPAAEMAAWLQEHAIGPRSQEVDPYRIALAPLDPAPPAEPAASAVIARLAYRYPHAPFTTLQATAAVTAIAKHDGTVLRRLDLKLPQRLSQQAALAATDRGTATHLFLEHLDFGSAATPEQLKAQLDRQLDLHLLTPLQAQACDLDAVAWMLSTELGRKLQARPGDLLRELPLVYPVSPTRFDRPPSEDPFDQVLLRGRIDLLVPDANGYALVDYKTDTVTAETLPPRIAPYRAQMELYREALQKILGQPIHAAHLVFLHARQIVSF